MHLPQLTNVLLFVLHQWYFPVSQIKVMPALIFGIIKSF